MSSLSFLAWRSLQEHRLRALLSAIIISLGVAMTIAAEYVSQALLATFADVGDGDMRITHGFMVEQFDLMLTGVSGVLIAAAAFLIFNTFAMTLTQRRQQIGLLRALGMTRAQTLRLALTEALLIGGMGVCAGLLLGPLLGQGIVAMMLLLAGDFLSFGAGSFSVATMALAAALGLAVTFIAVLVPARRATRVSPLAALRDGAPGSTPPPHSSSFFPLPSSFFLHPSSFFLHPSFFLFPTIALFTYLALSPPGEWADPPWNVWLTGLFLGVWLACLGALLPALLRWTGAAARRWWGGWSANGRLAADNLNRAPGRAALTALTLAIGLATIVSLTGFMTFAFDDLFGYTFNEMARRDMWAVFPFDLEQGTAALSGVDALQLPPQQIDAFMTEVGDRADVTPIRFASAPELSFMGSSYFTFVAEPAALQNGFFTLSEGDWATAVPLMEAGCGALVTPAVAQRLGVGVGEPFTISGMNGPVPCTLAGIGAGFVNASIVGSAAADQVGATAVVALLIAPHPNADLVPLIADIQRIADRSEKTYLTSMRSYAELMQEAVDIFNLALNGILLLAVVAAALGVVNTMMMSVQERRRELGLLRAVGATRGQVTAVVTGEALLLGVVGGLFGLLAGAGVIVILVVTYGGHSWGIPDLAVWPAAGRALRPALLNGLVGLIVMPLISAAAARWPVRQLLRGTAVQTLHPEHAPKLTRRRLEQSPRSLQSKKRDVILGHSQTDGGDGRAAEGLGWRALFLLATRSLTRSPIRAALSALAVTLGVTMVVAANTMGNGLRASFQRGDGRPDGTAWVVDFTEMSLQGVGVIILSAAAFLILNAFMMTVTQQQKEIGLLRALGMTRRQTLRLVLTEATLVGGAGVALGLLLGPLFGNGLLGMMEATGFAVTAGARPSPGAIGLAVVLGMGMTLLAALIPARRATRLSPLLALQGSVEWGARRAESRHVPYSAFRTPHSAGFFLLAAIALLIFIAPPARWAEPPHNGQWGLLLGAGWLAGVLLLLPGLVGWVARGGQRPLTAVGGVIGQLISSNLGRSRQRILLTLLTFVISLTMIVSTTGVLTYITQVLFDYLGEKTRNETSWGLWPFDQTQGARVAEQLNSAGLRPEIVADIYATVGDEAVIVRNFMVIAPEVSAMFPNFPSTIVDVEAIGHSVVYNFVEGNLAEAQAIMAAGCGLLIPPDVAARHQATVGTVITLQGVAHPLDCTVAGVGVTGLYPSTLISAAALAAFDVEDPTAVVVMPRPGADGAALAARLQALDRKYGDDLWAIRGEESAVALQAGGDMLMGLLNGMLLLALLAAGLGVVNTTMMSVTQRRRELGLLRAVGATRRQALRMVLGEMGLMGVIGGAVGLLAGVGITVAFAMSFGGRSYGLPDIPLWPAAWQAVRPSLLVGGLGLLLAPLISAAAAYWPARAILHGRAVETLREGGGR